MPHQHRPKIESSAGTFRAALIWAMLGGILAVLAQLLALALPSRSLDLEALLTLQSQLTCAPWIALCALGFDKLGRLPDIDPLARQSQARLSLFAIASFLLGLLTGAALAFVTGQDVLSWIVFGSLCALTSCFSFGRERLLARGRVSLANKAHSLALALTLAGLGFSYYFKLSIVFFSICWIAPLLGSNLFCLAASTSRFPGPFSLPLSPIKPILSKSLRLATPSLGAALLSSFDTALFRFGHSAAETLEYLLLSRSLFVAFSFSTLCASIFSHKIVSADTATFKLGALLTFLTHAAFSCSICIFIFTFGHELFPLVVPAAQLHHLHAFGFLCLLCLALARSSAETCFSASASHLGSHGAYAASFACFVGLALFSFFRGSSMEAAFLALSLAWLSPGLGYMAHAKLVQAKR